jgi:hypothetical protein
MSIVDALDEENNSNGYNIIGLVFLVEQYMDR